MRLLSLTEYEKSTAATRDARMEWWREARFGMFVHYGLYSLLGRNEWVMAGEGIPPSEYEKLADKFNPKPDATREWARLAKKAGMKYMVMTTRHHEGFSLWDSKANPYNSVNLGPKRDIVREFVEACREYDLRIGFYSSLMDWHHPDGWKCAYDSAARKRFTDYIEALNTELLTNYGKIDILWYDVPRPLASAEGWDSLERNQRLRALQPDIIINNRSKIDEDFGTPEENVRPADNDWEACMTFNGLSWGYVDPEQAKPYSYNAEGILKMLHTCTSRGGNLLLNIGPTPDGSTPPEAAGPLGTVGEWLSINGEAVYGKKDKGEGRSNLIGRITRDAKKVYYWNIIWSDDGVLTFTGYMTPLKNAYMLKDGSPLQFVQEGHRILLTGLPVVKPAAPAGINVIVLEFEETPNHHRYSYYPHISGEDAAEGVRSF